MDFDKFPRRKAFSLEVLKTYKTSLAAAEAEYKSYLRKGVPRGAPKVSSNKPRGVPKGLEKLDSTAQELEVIGIRYAFPIIFSVLN